MGKVEQLEAEIRVLIGKNRHKLLKPSAWEVLRKPQKRKAILLDAIEQLLINNYRPKSGYIDENIKYNHTGSLKKILRKKFGPTCDICQRGFILLSTVRFANKLSVEDYSNGNYTMPQLEKMTGVYDFFNFRELRKMEVAFEGASYDEPPSITKFREIWRPYGREWLGIAILFNAFKHGKFSPIKKFLK